MMCSGIIANNRNRNPGVLIENINDSYDFLNPNYVLSALLVLSRLISPSLCELLSLFQGAEV